MFQIAPRPTACGKTVAGPHPGHTVQRLLPGAEGGETETVHRGGELVQECDAFVECEAGEEVVDAQVQGGGGVAEEGRRAFGHVLRSLEEEEKQEEKQEEDLEAELAVVREQMSQVRSASMFRRPDPDVKTFTQAHTDPQKTPPTPHSPMVSGKNDASLVTPQVVP
ncbi:hypothetical protein BJ965_000654 [Streptomyces luteogriseus]|uniref:Uncharacterized protein n=1 Tax=Streptomyces luteogriseus TaxID=68233 RepID=A0A7W7DK44_9ACTN|nr:hypothetical protein [Streptomyces luteogriseus]